MPFGNHNKIREWEYLYWDPYNQVCTQAIRWFHESMLHKQGYHQMCSQVKSICTYLSTGTMLQGAALDDIIFQLRLEMTLLESVSSIAFVFAYVSVICGTM